MGAVLWKLLIELQLDCKSLATRTVVFVQEREGGTCRLRTTAFRILKSLPLITQAALNQMHLTKILHTSSFIILLFDLRFRLLYLIVRRALAVPC